MSTDGSDDEDLPPLESVSSSEYVDESDDNQSDFSDLDSAEPVMPSFVDKDLPNYKMAQKWLEQDRIAIDHHCQVIAVYTFCPFLYGHARQSDKHLGWCQKAGLLLSDVDYNTAELSDPERSAVDVLDRALHFCKSCMEKEDSPSQLTLLLQLADDIRPLSDVNKAVRAARRRGWFMVMLKGFADFRAEVGGVSIRKDNLVEVGCLYVVQQTAEHVVKYVKEKRDFYKEFQDSISQHEQQSEAIKKKGDDLFNNQKNEEAASKYSTAISCWPFCCKLYTNRALCYMEVRKFKSALSDGLRAIYLQPDWSKSHVRYIQALSACGEEGRAKRASEVFLKRFPKEQDFLQRGLDSVANITSKEPTEEGRLLLERLRNVCKQASEAYLHGNDEEAVVCFGQGVELMEKEDSWLWCIPQPDRGLYEVSVHFAFGLTLLKKDTYEAASKALSQFDFITEEHKSINFSPAHLGRARALFQLHRHADALEAVGLGLAVLQSYRPSAVVTWPGTEEIIQDCLPQNVEIKLQEFMDECRPVLQPDAICRYDNCLQYHTTTDIRTEEPEYRGHVTLQCSESCAISYHASCWRKYKAGELLIGSDKDCLLFPCTTPDCAGVISFVSIFDSKGHKKIKLDAPASSAQSKKTLAQQPVLKDQQLPRRSSSSSTVATLSKKEQKASRKKKLDKPVEPVAKETADEGVGEAVPLFRSDEKEEERCGGVKEEEVCEDVRVGSGEGCEEGAVGVAEDSRKAEDSVEVINRQQESEGGKEVVSGPKTKTRKKKAKQQHQQQQQQQQQPPAATTVSVGGASKDKDSAWNDIFTLPARKGLKHKASHLDEEQRKGSWSADPEAPFHPPDHLRKAIEEFESTEAAAIGLTPRPPLATPTDAQTTPSGGDKPHPQTAASYAHEITPPEITSEDLEFIFSYFSEILRSEGAMAPSDSRLQEPLSFLPDDKKLLIQSSGGLSAFLLRSPLFMAQSGLLCLAEDSTIVAASMNSGGTGEEGGGGGGGGGGKSQEAKGEKGRRNGVNGMSSSKVVSSTDTVHTGSQHNDSRSNASKSKSGSSGDSSLDAGGSYKSNGSRHSKSGLTFVERQLDDLNFEEEVDGSYKASMKTYGEELGSALNSPAQSQSPPPLKSPGPVPRAKKDDKTVSDKLPHRTTTTTTAAVLKSPTVRPKSAENALYHETMQPQKKASSNSNNSRLKFKTGEPNAERKGGSAGSHVTPLPLANEVKGGYEKSGTAKGKPPSLSPSSETSGEVNKTQQQQQQQQQPVKRNNKSLQKISEKQTERHSSARGGVRGGGGGGGEGNEGRAPAKHGGKRDGDHVMSSSTHRDFAADNRPTTKAHHDKTDSKTSQSSQSRLYNSAPEYARNEQPKLVKPDLKTSQASPRLSEKKPQQSAPPRPLCVSVGSQTQILLADRGTVTDPIPPVENFRDRYEKTYRDKKDLQGKLERSEDTRFKMQKEHKRELGKLEKRYKQESRDEVQARFQELERQASGERSQVQLEKKELVEQLKASKAETKSLLDKTERLRKDLTWKEQQLEGVRVQHQAEVDMVLSDKKRADDRAKLSFETIQKAVQRATNAEVELLSMKRDNIMRSGEQRLREIDIICSQLPPGNDFVHDWSMYKEKLKSSLDCFQNAMDDQISQIRSGKDLNSFEPIPSPAVPLPPNLASFRMPMVRPPFFPMMPVRGPLPPGATPLPPRPVMPGVPPASQAGAAVGGGVPVPFRPHPPTSGARLPPPGVSLAGAAASAVGYKPDVPATAVPSSEFEGFDAAARKTSFDRIVDKLAPDYPGYTRENFRSFLHEVRRTNSNTLSGLSLDSITEQVRGMIEVREKAKGGGGRGRGKGKQQKTLPPVAVAPPPINFPSDALYDDEGSCIICYEDMDDHDASRLNCGHRFHTECIKAWFKEQSTCPNCRNHALLPEEYPFLGQ